MNEFIYYKEHKILKVTYIKYTIITLFMCLLLIPGIENFKRNGDNLFHISINGMKVGNVRSQDTAEKLLMLARRNVAKRQPDFAFMNVEMSVTGEEILWGEWDKEEDVLQNMEEVLEASIQETLKKAYTVKVNDYMVNIASMDEVKQLFQAAVDRYDHNNQFEVNLVHDEMREFSIMTAQVVKKEVEEEEENDHLLSAGVTDILNTMGDIKDENLTLEETAFSDFEYGLDRINFEERIEIVEAYLPDGQVTPLDIAIEEMIKEQETPGEYEIVAGDTLTEISLKVNIPMERIVELNPQLLKSIDTPIHIGDKLIITIPEPELSVTWTERNYYEEYYDADVIYIDNDSWYTTQSVVLQQPSAGFRKIVADETFKNDNMISREIVKEEIVSEAVAKIVERGTKIPPTYIRPISGGKTTSLFGPRKSPTKGASSYHKGIDWAVPTGTAVKASSGGKVIKAGWGSGYGYVVYIEHPDGRQTIYAHLSKVLVKAGQTVKQGEIIAKSGNTGVSTGPHLHFEMRINGVAVNPLNYIGK